MPFDVATLTNLEEALSGCYKYHSQLDSFLSRSGVPSEIIAKARAAADIKYQNKDSAFARAPKRVVVKELIIIVSELGDSGDRMFADVITGLNRVSFPDANPESLAAIERLRQQVATDRQEAQRIREERRLAEIEKGELERKAKEAAYVSDEQVRVNFKDRFISLMAEANAQTRGYLFESFLNEFFDYEQLAPRGSFKITGEQIDGSFQWRNRTNFLEAKWVKTPVAGADFGAFYTKLKGKRLILEVCMFQSMVIRLRQ